MSDRCWMQVACRRADIASFAKLGFREDGLDEGGAISLVDEEANYAHDGEMPIVPFLATAGAGGDYGPSLSACDGTTVVTGVCDNYGHLVVVWDIAADAPTSASVELVRKYVAVASRASALLGLKQTGSDDREGETQ